LSLRLEWKFCAAKKWGEAVSSTTGGSKDQVEERVANQVVETWYILLYKAGGPPRLRMSDEDLPHEAGEGLERLV
jgi:hypothetical protein